MIEFLMFFLQVLTICLTVKILMWDEIDLKFLIIMISITQVIGFFYYEKLGILTAFVNLSSMIICTFIKTRKVLLSIIFPTISLILLVIADYISTLISIHLFNKSLSMVKNNPIHVVLLLCATGTISVILSIFLRCLFNKFKIHNLLNKRYGILFSFLVVITIVVFYVNILIGEQQGFTNENIQVNSVLFFIYFTLLLIVFMILTRIIMKENDIKNQQLQHERLQEYTKNLEELYTDMQKFRHDYINILSTMSEYIREKDVENLEKYFNDKIMPISQGMQSNSYKLGALKNLKIQEAKGVLSSKLIKSQESNIDTVIEVVEPIESINMDSINLCRCLGIVLDNAIEEAKLCEKAFIRVALIKREGSILIVVANTCRSNLPPLYKIYQEGFSTKGEKRGLGLSNLKEIVSRYEHVILDTYVKGNQFVQELEIFE